LTQSGISLGIRGARVQKRGEIATLGAIEPRTLPPIGHTKLLPPDERSTDKFRCMALCACGWAESRTVRSAKERPIALALKDLERAARKHAQETGHVVDLGDINGDARQITADSPES
jgi:hypothetical protein